MVTPATNTVYNCATCHEGKARHYRTGEWWHIRHDSLCDDAQDPVPVRLPVPERYDAQLALLDYVHRD